MSSNWHTHTHGQRKTYLPHINDYWSRDSNERDEKNQRKRRENTGEKKNKRRTPAFRQPLAKYTHTVIPMPFILQIIQGQKKKKKLTHGNIKSSKCVFFFCSCECAFERFRTRSPCAISFYLMEPKAKSSPFLFCVACFCVPD